MLYNVLFRMLMRHGLFLHCLRIGLDCLLIGILILGFSLLLLILYHLELFSPWVLLALMGYIWVGLV